ncbi:MAG: aldo/keto reductase [Nitrososphaerota archaeon]|nr:aldo/keto reductase [Nitrososphaerota archaeon]MDG6978768.1 aldo/keto reductase [Nitrososphaerota archaeon]
MQFSRLGESGLIVSRLAFGAMTFSSGNKDIPSVYKVNEKLAGELTSRALDAGINFFDTADSYAGGESEKLLGRFLKPVRDRVIIATKVGFRTGEPMTQAGLSRRHILWSVDRSLNRIGTDWIDLYIAHKEDPFTPLEETLEALDTVVRSGKVRYLGFSNWSAWKAAAALEIQRARGLTPFVCGQMNYSLVGRDIERDVIPMMKRYGIGLTVWSPLASGFLSGKYTRNNLKDSENRISGFDLFPFDKEVGFKVVEQAREIANAHSSSVAQVAISWLLAKEDVASVLLGATKTSQLEDNLGALSVQLTKEEVARLDAATALPPVYPTWFIENLIDQQVDKTLRTQ